MKGGTRTSGISESRMVGAWLASSRSSRPSVEIFRVLLEGFLQKHAKEAKDWQIE